MNSEQINELALALSKAQGEFRCASEDKVNPHFKSKYASLNSLWDACREGLSKNGLSVIQVLEGTECVKLITILAHSSGQWIRSELPVTSQKMTPQALGSAITYMKRYALSAIVGISSGDDDDGNQAQEVSKKNGTQQKTPAVTQKNEGYDEFCNRIGVNSEDGLMRGFILDICKKSNMTEIEVMNSAMHNENRFLTSFADWKRKFFPQPSINTQESN